MEVSEQTPVTFLPYGRQHITEADIKAVSNVLRSDWLTQGHVGPEFEAVLARRVGAGETVACSSGTAALHLSMLALGIGPGDAVVTSTITFLASANCARFVGAEVRFVDIDPDTGLIDVDSLQKVLDEDNEGRIKAVIPVHFAGQPADLAKIHALARDHGASVVDDACHAIGAEYSFNGIMHRPGDGSHSDMTVFSFHPVKHVAMGEGGAVATGDPDLARRLRLFRNHGIQKQDFTCDAMAYAADGSVNPWYYEMQEIGYNYRLTDIQAALGMSQLRRLNWSLERRTGIASIYRRLLHEKFPDCSVAPLIMQPDRTHAYHLFVVQIDFDRFGVTRAQLMNRLRERGIGTQVHYIPAPLQPYYRKRYDFNAGDYPCAERYYARALSLPMYPDLTEHDCERVVRELHSVLNRKETCQR